MPDGRMRGVNPDFNVVAQPVQAVHQLALGKVGKPAAQQRGP